MMIHLPQFKEKFYVDTDKIEVFEPTCFKQHADSNEQYGILIYTNFGTRYESRLTENENEMLGWFEKIKNQIMKAKNGTPE